jgi:hypothetical protein
LQKAWTRLNEANARLKEEKKKQAKLKQDVADKEKVLDALKAYTLGQTVPDLATAAGLGRDKTRRILHALLQEGLVFLTRVPKSFGSGKTSQRGWLLWRKAERVFSDEQLRRLREGECVEDVLGLEAVNGYGQPIALDAKE